MSVKYICPKCGESSTFKEWKYESEECELCGSHSSCTCPKCGEEFDEGNPEYFDVQKYASN